MNKIVKKLFLILATGLLFTSCMDFWAQLGRELMSPYDSVYLYPYGDYSGDTLDIPVGEDGTVCYEITFFNGEYSGKNDFVLSSDDESIATVEWSEKTIPDTGSFTVHAKKIGTCTITLASKEWGDTSSGYDVIYINVKPKTGISFNEQTKNVAKGDVVYLDYSIYPSGFYDMKWTSSNTYVAEVTSGGKVTGKKAGNATITLSGKYKNKTYSAYCDITVFDSSTWNVSITNESGIPSPFYPGETYQLEATKQIDSGYTTDIIWRSEDSSIASVSATGLVTAKGEGTTRIYASLSENVSVEDYCTVTVNRPPVACNQFFWGTWSRMDNGKTYKIEETYIEYENKQYSIQSSSAEKLSVDVLGDFVKDSDNVIKWYDNYNEIEVPFFRQGGTNLKYKVRVVGFEDEINSSSSYRAAGTDFDTSKGKGGLKVKGKSDRYSTYIDVGTTDADGYVELEAPVQGDTQTLTITDETTGDIVIVPGLKIENSGDFMGTIPMVKEDEYSLKITGAIAESDKTNGYLYGNNYKSYPLTLTITNISNIKSATAVASISCDDPNVRLKLVTNKDIFALDSYTISTMKGGQSKTIGLEVAYDSLTSEYKDVEINVRVENLDTGRVWVDYVPLRFFAGDMPISIATRSTERNENAALNGFLIYPDGNSKFFSVAESSNTTIYVPVFGDKNDYKLVFSGATVTGSLDESTEMYYTVALDKSSPIEVDMTAIKGAYNFGEDNDKEVEAFRITTDFEAYLSEGDIDFYTFKATSSSTEVHK